MSPTLVIPDQCKLKETMASISGTGRIRLAEENRWKKNHVSGSQAQTMQCDSRKNKKKVFQDLKSFSEDQY